jgi:hypothetical protein
MPGFGPVRLALQSMPCCDRCLLMVNLFRSIAAAFVRDACFVIVICSGTATLSRMPRSLNIPYHLGDRFSYHLCDTFLCGSACGTDSFLRLSPDLFLLAVGVDLSSLCCVHRFCVCWRRRMIPISVVQCERVPGPAVASRRSGKTFDTC